MNKWQKMGILASAGIFLFLGILFIVLGFVFHEKVLKFMGFIWTPLAALNLILILSLTRTRD